MRRFLTILFFFTSMFTSATAGVDLRTGNYFITYTDIAFTGSKAYLTRSYSSNSSYNGMFGHGWSTFMESRLYPFPDGSLLMKWWGGGRGDYYEPAVINKTGLYKMINAIVAQLIKTGKLANNPVEIAQKKSYYLANNLERGQKYADLQTSKILPAYSPPKDQQISWVLDVNQVIKWDGKIFHVKSWDDSYEFSNIGLLTQVNDEKYTMQLWYDVAKLKKILIDNKFTCNFETDSLGKITRMSGLDSGATRLATFRYDSLGNLVYSKDAADNVYRFGYDLYHNLVRIDYDDNRYVQMDYDPANNRLIKFRDKNGSFLTYQYPYFYTEDGKVNYDHYATTVKKYDSLGSLFFTHYKEYENRYKNDGSRYTYRIYEKTDTSFHEIRYSTVSAGNAWYRQNNRGQAWSQYDAKKRPVYLRINDTIYRTVYNKMELPESFARIDSVRADTTLYRYIYSDDGKLTGVIKNNIGYAITGSKAENNLAIKKDGNELKVKFLKGKPYSIEHKSWGMTLIDDAEWRKLDSTLHPSAYIKEVIAEKENEARSNDRQKESEKNREMAARKEAMAKRKMMTESKADDRRAKLLQLYAEYSDVMEAKAIRHEWIWEKL